MPPKKPKSRTPKEELECSSEFASDEEDLQPSSKSHPPKSSRATRSAAKSTLPKDDGDDDGDRRDDKEADTADTPSVPYVTARMRNWKGAQARPQEPYPIPATKKGVVDMKGKSEEDTHVHDQDTLALPDVFADDERANLKRIEDILAEVQIVSTASDVTVPEEATSRLRPKTVHDRLSTEAVHYYTPYVYLRYDPSGTHARDMWQFIAVASSRDAAGDRYITNIPVPKLSKQNAELLCGRLVETLNRYPNLEHVSTTNPPPYQGIASFFKLAQHNRCFGLMNVIFDSISSHAPFNLVPAQKVVTLPGMNRSGNGVLSFRIKHFDPSDNAYLNTEYQLKMVNLDARYDAVLLPSPDLVRFARSPGQRPWLDESHLVPIKIEADGSRAHDFQVVLPKTARSSLKGQEEGIRELMKLAMIVSTQLHGTILPRSMISSQVMLLLKRLGLQGTRAQQVYSMRRNKWWRGRDFLRLHRNNRVAPRYIAIYPSKELLKDVVRGTLPGLILPSIDMARVLPVLDACMNVLRQTKDPRQAFMAAARAIELEKRNIYQGIPSSNICRCVAGDMGVACIHHCGACGEECDTKELVLGIESLRVCRPCARMEAKRQDGGPFIISRISLSRCVVSDLSKLGIARKDKLTRDIFKEGKAYLRRHFNGTSPIFMDEYTQRSMQLSAEGEVRSLLRYPLQPSVDAVWPYLDSGYDLRIKHVPGNLAITLPPVNFAKFVFAPALLHYIGAYFVEVERLSTDNSGQSHEKLSRIEALETTILAECSTISKIAIKSKVLAKHYIRTGTVDPQRIALDKQEWITGTLRHETGPWDSEGFFRTTFGGKVDEFSKRQISLIRPLIKQIEQEFQVMLPRSEDGCPWFAHDSTMPRYWSWTHAFREACGRLDRMVELCNGLWPTVDTPLSIWIEIIFQECARRCTQFTDGFWTAADKETWHEEYQEFLRLPIVCQLRWHPLSLSVGHKLHGQQMRTGWKADQDPQTLADRINADNNLLVETWTSNRFKSNFATRHYEFLRNIFRNINLPKKYYDPDGPLDPIPPHLRIRWHDEDENLKEVDFEDEISAVYKTKAIDLPSDDDLSDDDLSDNDLSDDDLSDDEMPGDPEDSSDESSEDDEVAAEPRPRRRGGRKVVHSSESGSSPDPPPGISISGPEPSPLAKPAPPPAADMSDESPEDDDVPTEPRPRRRGGRNVVHSSEIDSSPEPPPDTSMPSPEPAPPAAKTSLFNINQGIALAHSLAAFPLGCDIIPTPNEGLFCTFYAFIESIKAQHPGVPLPDVKRDLIPMLDSPEMEADRAILKALDPEADAAHNPDAKAADAGGKPKIQKAYDAGQGNLLLDHAFKALYLWYQKTHKIDTAFGLIRAPGRPENPRLPEVYHTDTTSKATLMLWIHCDMASENVREGIDKPPPPGVPLINHFSGLRQKAPYSVPKQPKTHTGPLTPNKPKPQVGPQQSPRQSLSWLGPPQPGKEIKLALSPPRKDETIFGSIGRAAGKRFSLGRKRGEEPDSHDKRSSSLMSSIKSLTKKAAPAAKQIFQPRRSSRLSRLEIPDTDDESQPSAAETEKDVGKVPAFPYPDAPMHGPKTPQPSRPKVIEVPDTVERESPATPGAGTKRRYPGDREQVPTPTRLVKAKLDPAQLQLSASGHTLPVPSASQVSDVPRESMIDLLRQSLIIDNEIIDTFPELVRDPQVWRGLEQLRAAARRGDAAEFHVIWDDLRKTTHLPELGDYGPAS